MAKESSVNRSTKRLLIVSTNLNGVNLVANHGRFAEFAKISCYTYMVYIHAIYSMLYIHGNHADATALWGEPEAAL